MRVCACLCVCTGFCLRKWAWAGVSSQPLKTIVAGPKDSACQCGPISTPNPIHVHPQPQTSRCVCVRTCSDFNFPRSGCPPPSIPSIWLSAPPQSHEAHEQRLYAKEEHLVAAQRQQLAESTRRGPRPFPRGGGVTSASCGEGALTYQQQRLTHDFRTFFFPEAFFLRGFRDFCPM